MEEGNDTWSIGRKQTTMGSKENLKKNPVIVLSEKIPISLTTKMIEKVKKNP